MPSKTDPTVKLHSADDITGEDILSLYQGVLPLLYTNPEKTDLTHDLNKLLLKFIDYKLWHWVVSDFRDPAQDSRYSGHFDKWDEHGDESYSLTTVQSEVSGKEALFVKSIEKSYENMLKRIEEIHGKVSFDYYAIRSEGGDVMAGFFRLKIPGSDSTFSLVEKQILEKLKPHILLILQTVSLPTFHSETYNFYDSYIRICSTIAKDFALTATEAKLLSEILFGYTNAQIAERNFISIPTVKKHLKHIFKKTGSKNRMDFIGKFFTSPEKIELG